MSFAKKKVTILGATGSIGTSTIDVILSNSQSFEVYGVTANNNVKSLAQLAIKTNAKKAVIADRSLLPDLQELLSGYSIVCKGGAEEIEILAREPVDFIMAAIMGFAGLRAIIAGLEQGTTVAIANKEPLVAAGQMIMDCAKKNNAQILPVDSEHNAIFQVFEKENRQEIEKIILTASGGPFLNWSKEDIEKATPEQAIKHPNWEMGKKISVDSATMMNKALEVIEAHHLFDMPPEQIDVIIHPQSVIHSMVSYKDGSILSQMGASDMRTPIAYALSYPKRMDSHGSKLNFSELLELTLIKPDTKKFPALTYAYEAISLGQNACISLNAANEVAVDLFLQNKIAFVDITKAVAHALEVIYPKLTPKEPKTVAQIEKLDNTVRQFTKEFLLETKNSEA